MPKTNTHTEPLLIETICVRDGWIENIEYHNTRANRARQQLLGIATEIDLSKHIDTKQATSKVTKCRVTYSRQVEKVEYEPYTLKPIRSLQCVDIGDYSYDHKYKDRFRLHEFYKQRGTSDDILMIKNGLVTDTYYCNVAFKKDCVWYTPQSPLLEGTKRATLLAQGLLATTDIQVGDIIQYSEVSLFNAMIDFGQVVVGVESIIRL